MTIHHTYIGCDIAKHALDFFDPSTRRLARISNDASALRSFVATLDPATRFVVFEATGSHDRLLRHILAEAGIAAARINPVMLRRFAQARGRLAKACARA